MGRVSKQKVIDSLHATKGAVYLAASRLNCSAFTVYDYVNKYEDVKAVKEYYDGELTDIAQLKHREKILGGDWPAIKYQLATKGKDRGYTERQEVTGADGEGLILKLEWGDVADATD